MSFSYQKARYLTTISRLIVDGELDLDEIAKLDDQEAVARLCELKGVGRWTAEYVLLRGLLTHAHLPCGRCGRSQQFAALAGFIWNDDL